MKQDLKRLGKSRDKGLQIDVRDLGIIATRDGLCARSYLVAQVFDPEVILPYALLEDTQCIAP